MTQHRLAVGRRSLDYTYGCKLSPRERDVVREIAYGIDTDHIAIRLGISNFTLKNHIRSIFGKLGVWNRQQIVIYALCSGIVTMDELKECLPCRACNSLVL